MKSAPWNSACVASMLATVGVKHFKSNGFFRHLWRASCHRPMSWCAYLKILDDQTAVEPNAFTIANTEKRRAVKCTKQSQHPARPWFELLPSVFGGIDEDSTSLLVYFRESGPLKHPLKNPTTQCGLSYSHVGAESTLPGVSYVIMRTAKDPSIRCFISHQEYRHLPA